MVQNLLQSNQPVGSFNVATGQKTLAKPTMVNNIASKSTPLPQAQAAPLMSYLQPKAPAPSLSLGSQTSTPAVTMGSVANNPMSLVSKPTTTIPQSQISSTQPTITQANPQNNVASSGNPSIQGNSFNPTFSPTQQPIQSQAPQQSTLAQNPTYGGIMGQLIQQSQQGSPLAQQGIQQLLNTSGTNPLQSGGAYDAYSKAVQNLSSLKQGIAQSYGDVERNPIPLEFQQGREQVMSRQYASQLDAAQQAVNQAQQALGYGIQEQQTQQSGLGAAIGGANTQQQLQQSGLTSAAGFAQPQLGQIGSQQYYQPLQAGQSGGGGLPLQAQSFVNSLAQQVKNGQMTRGDAESRLSTYGITGLQALNTALGSGFNTNASNASAATTATGQQIQAAITPANQALDALQEAFNGLPALQSTGIPILNQFTQNAAMATGLGRNQASAFQGALNEARSRIDAALTGVIGVNAAAAQAHALLPDNMVPSEIPQKIAAAKMYLQNQLQSYSLSGQQGQQTPQGASKYDW